MLLDAVDVLAEVADPAFAALDESHEGVDVGAAIFATDNRFVVEASSGDLLSTGQLAERFDEDGERDGAILGQLVRGRDSLGGHSQQRLVAVVLVHGLALELRLLRRLRSRIVVLSKG